MERVTSKRALVLPLAKQVNSEWKLMPKEKKFNARDGAQRGKAAKYITSKINFKNILQSISQEENISYFFMEVSFKKIKSTNIWLRHFEFLIDSVEQLITYKYVLNARIP